MGAWGIGSFDNDDAMDFVATIQSLADVEAKLNALSNKDAPLEADDASEAIAACDVVAISLGRAAANPPNLPQLKVSTPSDDFLATARDLIDRVRTLSELADLWAESDEIDGWHAALDDLLLRLTPSIPYDPPKPETSEQPEDFLGYCYICYGAVTERDGLSFEYVHPEGGTLGHTPHRRCIEDRLDTPGPHWFPDGSPRDAARLLMLRDMGLENPK